MTATAPATSPFGFTAEEAVGLAGSTYRRADYACRRGVLRPSVVEAGGSGTRRRYSYTDVLALAVLTRTPRCDLIDPTDVVAAVRENPDAQSWRFPFTGGHVVVDRPPIAWNTLADWPRKDHA